MALTDEEQAIIRQRQMTMVQQELAAAGGAVNACPSCGNYRADMKPPILHRDGCPNTGDWMTRPIELF